MKILVVGAAGLLGSHIVELLHKNGHKIVGIDNFMGSYRESAQKDKMLFVEGDCCDLQLMKDITEDVDIIFHCACAPYEGFSVVSPYSVSKSVFDGTACVATAAAQNGVKQIINFSSMARYGAGNPNYPFDENSPTKPIDPYGVAKLSSEQLLNNMSDLYGFKVVHLVPHNVFGTRFGVWNDPYRGVISIMINRLLRDEPIYIFGDGTQKRSFSFADDVLSFIPDLFDAHIKNKDVFNIGPDDLSTFISINDLAQMVQSVAGKRAEIIYCEKKGEAKHAWCSADKIKRTFGWRSQKTLEQGIVEMFEYISSVGPKEWNYDNLVEITRYGYPESWRQKK